MDDLTRRLQIRLTEQDMDRLDRIAERYGGNRSTAIRAMIRRETDEGPERDPPPARGAGTTTPPLGDQ